MPRKSRRVTTASSFPTDLPAVYPAASDPAPAPPKPPDPPRIAARLLIARALSEAGIGLEDAAQDGAITLILVPSADWAHVARSAWAEWSRPGSEACEASTRAYNNDKLWTSITAEEAPRPKQVVLPVALHLLGLRPLEAHHQDLGRLLQIALPRSSRQNMSPAYMGPRSVVTPRGAYHAAFRSGAE
jgi:hypothetical protein